jgi:TctA family transporter
VAVLGSFFAGRVATLLVALFAPPLTAIALKFGAAEYFSLTLLLLTVAVLFVMLMPAIRKKRDEVFVESD